MTTPSDTSPTPDPAREDSFAAQLRGFGPAGLVAIAAILLTGNVVVGRMVGRAPSVPVIVRHLIPTTIESGPTRGTTEQSRKPASRIQPQQSAPV